MKYFTLALSLFLSGCYLTAIPDSGEPVYKYNPQENRMELTHPESELRYNVYQREWVYVR